MDPARRYRKGGWRLHVIREWHCRIDEEAELTRHWRSSWAQETFRKREFARACMPFESPSSAFGTFSRGREKGVNKGDIAADGLMAMACAQEVRIHGLMTVRVDGPALR